MDNLLAQILGSIFLLLFAFGPWAIPLLIVIFRPMWIVKGIKLVAGLFGPFGWPIKIPCEMILARHAKKKAEKAKAAKKAAKAASKPTGKKKGKGKKKKKVPPGGAMPPPFPP